MYDLQFPFCHFQICRSIFMWKIEKNIKLFSLEICTIKLKSRYEEYKNQ